MKQTKITIILDQPLHTETVTRAILGDKMAYGAYASFSQDRVTVEEIDSEAEQLAAFDEAERRWPIKDLQARFEAGEELTPREDKQLFGNMDKHVWFAAGVRWINQGKKLNPATLLAEKIKADDELRIAWQANIAMAFKDAYENEAHEYPNDALSSAQVHKIANEAANNFLSLLCETSFKNIQ